MFREEFGESNWRTFYEIAKHESNFNPKAFNPESHKTCNGSYGVMQVACINYKGNPNDLYDIKTNLKVAHEIFLSQGFGAWKNVCKKIGCGVK